MNAEIYLVTQSSCAILDCSLHTAMTIQLLTKLKFLVNYMHYQSVVIQMKFFCSTLHILKHQNETEGVKCGSDVVLSSHSFLI
jgi:hypothetical protein